MAHGVNKVLCRYWMLLATVREDYKDWLEYCLLFNWLVTDIFLLLTQPRRQAEIAGEAIADVDGG